MSTAAIDFSKYEQQAPTQIDFSRYEEMPQPKNTAPAVSQWDREQEQGHQLRLSALAGLTGMPTPNMSDQDRASFQQGKAAGAVSVPLVAGATTAATTGALGATAAALAPIAKKYGIKALEGAGLGAGYKFGRDLYESLKKIYGGTE